MNCYIITKNSKGSQDWSDFSELGKTFDGVVFTLNAYEKAENDYLNFIFELMDHLKIESMHIKRYALENLIVKKFDGKLTDRQTMEFIIKSILRYKNGITDCTFYCKNKLRVSFCFDFKLYICCNIRLHSMEKIASKFGLFVEIIKSNE